MQPENIEKPQGRSGGQSFFKTILLTIFSVMVVFLVWLFYPVSAPQQSLREYLPALDGAVIETHEPGEFWDRLRAEGFFSKLLKLPVAEELKQQHSISATEAEVEQALKQIDKLSIIFNRIPAICVGRYEDDQLCSVIAVDNIGYLAAKIAHVAYPKVNIKGVGYAKIPIKEYVPESVFDNLYLGIIPGTRNVIVCTSEELLAARPTVNQKHLSSIFFDKKSKEGGAVEINLSYKPPASTFYGFSVGGKSYPVRAEKVNAYFCWRGEELSGDFSVEVDRSELPELSTLSGETFLPAKRKGLGCTLNISAQDARKLSDYLEGTTPQKFKPVLKYFRDNFTGGAYFGFYPKTNSISGGLGVAYSVTNRAKAQTQIFDAVSGVHKEFTQSTKDMLTKMLLMGLRPYRQGDAVVMPLPFVGKRNYLVNSYGSAGKRDYGLLSIGGGDFAKPELYANYPAQQVGDLCLSWKYSPEALAITESLHDKDLQLLLNKFSGMSKRQLDEVFDIIRAVQKTFASLDSTIFYLGLLDKDSGKYHISGSYSFKLRIQ